MNQKNIDAPGVIAPPPIIYLAFLILGLILHYTLRKVDLTHLFPLFLRLAFAFMCVIPGIAVATWAAILFKDAGTNLDPRLPVKCLVADGPYRLSRNPIYLGMMLVYMGIAFAFGSAWNLILMLPLILVMDFGVILREETYLERKFGGDYMLYKMNVRRWL